MKFLKVKIYNYKIIIIYIVVFIKKLGIEIDRKFLYEFLLQILDLNDRM